jgi:spermidine synthase
VVLGDARVSLEREQPHDFDVLVLDAFSGDAVPLHLLTIEAFQLYFRHLKPDGVLAVHITNRYLDLAPVVAGACEPLGKRVRVESSAPEPNIGTEAAVWAVVTASAEPLPARRHRRAWSDDYSNLLQVVRR